MQPVWYDQGKDRTGREKGMDIVGVSKVGAAELSDSLEVGVEERELPELFLSFFFVQLSGWIVVQVAE